MRRLTKTGAIITTAMLVKSKQRGLSEPPVRIYATGVVALVRYGLLELTQSSPAVGQQPNNSVQR